MTSFNLNYLLKTLFSERDTLGCRVLTCEFGEAIQSKASLYEV